MKHRIVTAAQMKEIERAGNAHGLPYLQMMENAGLAAYAELLRDLPQGKILFVMQTEHLHLLFGEQPAIEGAQGANLHAFF